jgi:hypothetical protein
MINLNYKVGKNYYVNQPNKHNVTSSMATDFEYYAHSMNLETVAANSVWQSKMECFSLPENHSKAQFQKQCFKSNFLCDKIWRLEVYIY